MIVTAADRHGRYALFNRELSIYKIGGTEKKSIEDPDDLLRVLAELFGLSFPSGTRFGAPGAPWAR